MESEDDRLAAALKAFALAAMQAKVDRVRIRFFAPRNVSSSGLKISLFDSSFSPQNDRKNYLKIVEELSLRDALVLQRWYTALVPCVALVHGVNTRELVHQIFTFSFAAIMPPPLQPEVAAAANSSSAQQSPAAAAYEVAVGRSLGAVHAFCNFLVYLTSANADFLTATLRLLTQHLLYAPGLLHESCQWRIFTGAF